MYSLGIVHNRMLIRVLLLAVFVSVLLSRSMVCYASELDSIETTEETVADEEPVDTEETISETVSGSDLLPTEDDFLRTDSESNTTEVTSFPTETVNSIYDALLFISGVLVFFVVVILCKYSYKFFNIFF